MRIVSVKGLKGWMTAGTFVVVLFVLFLPLKSPDGSQFITLWLPRTTLMTTSSAGKLD